MKGSGSGFHSLCYVTSLHFMALLRLSIGYIFCSKSTKRGHHKGIGAGSDTRSPTIFFCYPTKQLAPGMVSGMWLSRSVIHKVFTGFVHSFIFRVQACFIQGKITKGNNCTDPEAGTIIRAPPMDMNI